MDLHEILHGGSFRRRNHLLQILCRSVEEFRICAGSNFAILPLLSRSPLTQGWRYRAACDDHNVNWVTFFSKLVRAVPEASAASKISDAGRFRIELCAII